MKEKSLHTASDYPVGSSVTLLDAWMRNPRKVRITKHPDYDPYSIICEDERGVVYTAKTSRIVDEPTKGLDEIDDLLGEKTETQMSTEDLLGG